MFQIFRRLLVEIRRQGTRGQSIASCSPKRKERARKAGSCRIHLVEGATSHAAGARGPSQPGFAVIREAISTSTTARRSRCDAVLVDICNASSAFPWPTRMRVQDVSRWPVLRMQKNNSKPRHAAAMGCIALPDIRDDTIAFKHHERFVMPLACRMSGFVFCTSGCRDGPGRAFRVGKERPAL